MQCFRSGLQCERAAKVLCQLSCQGKAKAGSWSIGAAAAPLPLRENPFSLFDRDAGSCIPDADAVIEERQAQLTLRWAVAKSVFQQVGNDFCHYGIGCGAGCLRPIGPLRWPMPGSALQGCGG